MRGRATFHAPERPYDPASARTWSQGQDAEPGSAAERLYFRGRPSAARLAALGSRRGRRDYEGGFANLCRRARCSPGHARRPETIVGSWRAATSASHSDAGPPIGAQWRDAPGSRSATPLSRLPTASWCSPFSCRDSPLGTSHARPLCTGDLFNREAHLVW
jgi:hypothetical protein